MFNVVICLVTLYSPLKFHKNLVFAFFMHFEVNFQGKAEGAEGRRDGNDSVLVSRSFFSSVVQLENHTAQLYDSTLSIVHL